MTDLVDNQSTSIKYDPDNININYTRPIDLFFERQQAILKSIVKDPNAPINSASSQVSTTKARPELLYDALTSDEIKQTTEKIKDLEAKAGIKYPDTKTFIFVSFLCQSILKIRTLVRQKKAESESESKKRNQEHDPKDMIDISLNDMKIFNTILNIIIIDGIYPCLTPGVGVPLSLRIKNRQNLQSTSNLVGGAHSGNVSAPSTPVLRYAQLFHILNDMLVPCLVIKDDVRNLILIGSYFPDLLTIACELAYNTANTTLNLPQDVRNLSLRNFKIVMDQMDTYSLYLNFTSLIRPKAPAWIVMLASKMLAMLPITRPSNGVLCLIEFISGVRDKPDINVEDLDKATRVLKSIPKNIKPEVYYQKIGAQLIGILALKERENTVAATVHILSQLMQQKKEMVQVGVQDKIIETISPYSLPALDQKVQSPTNQVLVSSPELQTSLSAFISLLRSSQPLELIHEIGKFSLISLWTLLCYAVSTKRPFEEVKSIIVAFIALQPDDYTQIQKLIFRNFVQTSGSNKWVWGLADDGGVEIRVCDESSNLTILSGSTKQKAGNLFDLDSSKMDTEDGIKELESQLEIFGKISERTSILSEHILEPLHYHFVEQLKTKDTFISSFFVLLIKEWLSFRQIENSKSNLKPSNDVKIKHEQKDEDDDREKEDALGALVNAKLLEMMYTNHKESLLDSPIELLMVIHGMLEDYVSSLERIEEAARESQSQVSGPESSHVLDLTNIKTEEDEEQEEKYIPKAIKSMLGIVDITNDNTEQELIKESSPESSSKKPLIEDLDEPPKEPTNSKKHIIEEIPNDDNNDGDAEEVVNLCFSLLLAISEDLSSSKNKDSTSEEDNDEEEEEEAKITELRTLEAVLPQLEYVIEHAPENLLKSKAVACRDTIVQVLQVYFPDEEYHSNIGTKLHEQESLLADKKQLSKAIKLLDDPLVPIQANGLYILKSLIDARSPVVSNWAMVVQIYLSKLKSEDSFVYINAVKGLFAVCDIHKDQVIKYLTAIFAGIVPDDEFLNDSQKGTSAEEIGDARVSQKLSDAYTKSIINYMSVDETLRLGEVLIKVINRLGLSLRGSLADTICGTMIQVISNKRGTKPYPDLIRMSAMSVLTSAFDANALELVSPARGGTGWLNQVLDCVLGVLQLENKPAAVALKPSIPEPSTSSKTQTSEEKEDERIKTDNLAVEQEFAASGGVLMRRSALHLIGTVFKNLHSAATLPAGFMSSIKIQVNVASHDSDPVIRANADTLKDIIYDLEMAG